MGRPGKGGGNVVEFEGEVMLADPSTKTKRPPMYKVVLLNDDFTPMDFVVMVIEHIFRKTHEEAVELMLAVHEKGQAIVGVYTREVAETKVDQVIEYARINEHPLQCAMEPE
jgi:ATP-dependent Clp protease adaptor protein ClpS